MKFGLGCKNLKSQARSGRPKTVDFLVYAPSHKGNLTSSTQRVSDEIRIPHSNVVCYCHNLEISIQSCQIVPVIKILQNFWLTLIFIVCYSSRYGMAIVAAWGRRTMTLHPTWKCFQWREVLIAIVKKNLVYTIANELNIVSEAK